MPHPFNMKITNTNKCLKYINLLIIRDDNKEYYELGMEDYYEI